MTKIRLLLADDHTLFRQGLSRLLSGQHDIELVGEAKDGEEAIALAVRLVPDVALIDIAMPKYSGDQVTRQIKADCPGTGVLVLTAHDEESYVIPCIQAGADGYLLKDIDRSELLSAIRLVHSGKKVFDHTTSSVVESASQFASPSLRKGPFDLGQREIQILKLTARGMTNKEISAALHISENTVRAHLRSIYAKLNATSRTEVVASAIRSGIVAKDELTPIR